MGYLIVEIAVLLAAAVLLGVAVGWLAWRRGRRRVSSAEVAAMEQERRQVAGERDDATSRFEQRDREYRRLRNSHDALLSERSQILIDRDAIRTEVETLRRELDRTEQSIGLPREIDDLRAITGVDASIEAALHREGIHSFRQLARLSVDGLARLREALAEHDCTVRPVDWADQATVLHRDKYGLDPS